MASGVPMVKKRTAFLHCISAVLLVLSGWELFEKEHMQYMYLFLFFLTFGILSTLYLLN